LHRAIFLFRFSLKISPQTTVFLLTTEISNFNKVYFFETFSVGENGRNSAENQKKISVFIDFHAQIRYCSGDFSREFLKQKSIRF
jgi:hypothetical protein